AQAQGVAPRLDRVFDGPVRGAGAGQREEHAREVVRRANREEPLRDIDHREMRIHEEDKEAVTLERIHRRLQDLRMDVPQVVRRPLAREVDVLLALDVTSQWATNNLGNVHPEILKARSEEHTSELQS